MKQRLQKKMSSSNKQEKQIKVARDIADGFNLNSLSKKFGVKLTAGDGSRGRRGANNQGTGFEKDLVDDINLFIEEGIETPSFKYPSLMNDLYKDILSKHKSIQVNLEGGANTKRPLEFTEIGAIIGGTAINVGNPHIVFFVDEIKNFDIEKIGPQIENHKMFPEKCNVTIAKVINKNLIKVKVWERGAGLTKACGTAACATAFAGTLNKLTDHNTDIEFETGKLSIFIDEKNSIHMKGPVSDIKEISIKL